MKKSDKKGLICKCKLKQSSRKMKKITQANKR